MAQEQLKNPAARVEATQSGQVVRQGMNVSEQSSAGQLVTWVMITLIAAAEVFVDERLGGTLRRMASTLPAISASTSGRRPRSRR